MEDESEIIEALTKRFEDSLKAEADLMNIPIPATDRALKTLLDARKLYKPERESALKRLSTRAKDQVMRLYPAKKKKKKKKSR